MKKKEEERFAADFDPVLAMKSLKQKGLDEQELFKKWMLKTWGKRCKTYNYNCDCCGAWKCFDFITKSGKYDNPIADASPELKKKLQYIIDDLEDAIEVLKEIRDEDEGLKPEVKMVASKSMKKLFGK
jgi:hypothetical protein